MKGTAQSSKYPVSAEIGKIGSYRYLLFSLTTDVSYIYVIICYLDIFLYEYNFKLNFFVINNLLFFLYSKNDRFLPHNQEFIRYFFGLLSESDPQLISVE